MTSLRRDRKQTPPVDVVIGAEPDDATTNADALDTELPATDTADVAVQWAPEGAIRKGYGGSALSFSLAGLAASFFVGWAFPLALVGLVLGIIAVAKKEESTLLGWWAVGLGILALGYSAGWLWWANSVMHFWF